MTEIEIPNFQDTRDLIRSINPEMSPEQVVAQIKEYNRLESSSTTSPTDHIRREFLKEHGYKPDNWTFYSNSSPFKGQTAEDMLKRLARPFPGEVEFLIIQGSFVGGITGTPGMGSWGAARYKYSDSVYTAFVRVRPKQLSG